MYNNLIEEDIMILDNEFFKINMMFETVNKMYDIKQRELEYNYIYTESINEEYIDLYTEAEEAKDRKEQGLLGRLFTAILNFIRKIRAKILRFFGNDKKAAELEAKIKGNPKLANQTVEITNTIDAEKAIDEGTSFFAGLINKIVGGTATEADADAAEEKNKSLLSRIGIFAGGALLAAGGAKVASDKLKERGVTKQTIKETVSNLLKREKDTKKKAAKVTQENEQNVQKGDQSLKNNSQSGNEENTKAGRRIMGSFKGFISDVGKFFTGKASELKSKFNSSTSNNDNDDKPEDEQATSSIDGLPEYYKEMIDSKDQKEFLKFMNENDEIITELKNLTLATSLKDDYKNLISEYNLILNGSLNGSKNIECSMTFKKIKTYNQKLKDLLNKAKAECDSQERKRKDEYAKYEEEQRKKEELESKCREEEMKKKLSEPKNLTPEEKELEKKASNLINTIRNHKDYDFLSDSNKKMIDKIERKISSQLKINTIKEYDIKNLEYVLTKDIHKDKNKKLFEEYEKSDEYKKYMDLYNDVDDKLYRIIKIDKQFTHGNKEHDIIYKELLKLKKYYHGEYSIEEFKKNVQRYTQELENLGKKISELEEEKRKRKDELEEEERKRKDEYDKKQKEEYNKKYGSFGNEYRNSDEYKKLSSMNMYFQKFLQNLCNNEDIEDNDPTSLFDVNIVEINNYLNTLTRATGKQVKENGGVDYYKKKCKEAYDKYENLLNKVKSFDKKNKITNESSYDLINDILTILENSF